MHKFASTSNLKIRAMNEDKIQEAFALKRNFFDNGGTREYKFRIEQLKALKATIKKYENEVLDALHNDMQKPIFEAYSSEVGFVYEEINYTIKHLHSWMKPKRVCTPMVIWPSKSQIISEPLGIVLIIGPWNYPFQLLLAPLVGAIAAGNCAILKPSDNTRNTANVVNKIISETFSPNLVSCVLGPGAMIGPMLLDKFKFNHIFFTGSQNIGKQILAMAAKNLTPTTLELGGKSPAIVHFDANLKIAAQRLIWAKLFNAGQTCVAPDYLLVEASIKQQFTELMISTIKQFLGDNPQDSPHFTRIVNNRRFSTLVEYLKCGNIMYGGHSDEAQRYIEPTLIDNVTTSDSIMNEEIFGPILPILTYSKIDEIIPIIRRNRYPLALYLFTQSRKIEQFVLKNIEFGGGAINNALTHLINPKLPFGGVGSSGMGSYHGKKSFITMSHQKSILKTSTRINIKVLFPPYNKQKLKFAKIFMH